MKKMMFLFVATALFFACSSEDSPVTTTVTEADLIGKWNATAMNSSLEVTATIQGISTSYTAESTGKDFNFVYEFASNPNMVSGTGSFTTVVTTTVAGQSTTQEIPTSSLDGLDNGTWTLNNNVISIESNGNSEDATIQSFSNNQMVLKIDVDQATNVSGIPTVAKGDLYVTLNKQ